MGILDSIRGDGKLQTEKKFAVKEAVSDKTVDAIIERYEAWPAKAKGKNSWEEYFWIAEDSLQDFTIKQEIIDGFCLRLESYQDREFFEYSGLFISALVQNAYDNGCNDLVVRVFELDSDIEYVGRYVSGTEEDPLRITLDGTFGTWCGAGAKHARFIMPGDIGWMCAVGARYSEYILFDDEPQMCGYMAEHCDFTFYGDVSDSCGNDAKYCTFSSPHKEVLEKIRQKAHRSCSFYLINPDGSKEVFG